MGKYRKPFSEAVAQRCSVKKVLLEISQNLQKNTSTGGLNYRRSMHWKFQLLDFNFRQCCGYKIHIGQVNIPLL